MKRQQEIRHVRSGIDESLIYPGARANLERLNEHRAALGMIAAPEQSIGQLHG